jgi:hypothetical protein
MPDVVTLEIEGRDQYQMDSGADPENSDNDASLSPVQNRRS